MPDNPDAQLIVSNFAKALDRAQLAEVEPRRAERDRLVWYIGIAGYVLVNAQGTWRVLLGHDLLATDLAWLSAPWTLAALLSLVAHFLTDEWIDRENLYYHSLRAEADRLSSLERPIEEQEWKELIVHSQCRLKHLKAKVDRRHKWARRFKLAASVCLFGAFFWSAAGPFVLRASGSA